MDDVDPSHFTYKKRPTVSSFLWALWRCMPRRLRLTFYLALLRKGEKTNSFRVNRLPFGLYAKYGIDTRVVEALATQYVATNTTIPVPTVLDVLRDDSARVLIIMTEVPGRTLGQMEGSLDEVSAEQLSVFAQTLRDWLTQLRALEPPTNGAVTGFLDTRLSCYRASFDELIGPFASVDAFHAEYFCRLPETSDATIRALAARVREKKHRTYFTHGDISPNNILVDVNWKPTALIDWGCAAWMPEYWELTMTLWRRQRYPNWFVTFKDIFPRYKQELAVEMELWKTICPW